MEQPETKWIQSLQLMDQLCGYLLGLTYVAFCKICKILTPTLDKLQQLMEAFTQ